MAIDTFSPFLNPIFVDDGNFDALSITKSYLHSLLLSFTTSLVTKSQNHSFTPSTITQLTNQSHRKTYQSQTLSVTPTFSREGDGGLVNSTIPSIDRRSL